jgi:hypothetical protein
VPGQLRTCICNRFGVLLGLGSQIPETAKEAPQGIAKLARMLEIAPARLMARILRNPYLHRKSARQLNRYWRTQTINDLGIKT